MRENEGQVDLVGSLGVSSPAEGKVPRCSPSSRSDETKRRHSFVADQDVRDSELALPSSPTPGNAGWSSHVYTLTPRNESRRQSEFPKLQCAVCNSTRCNTTAWPQPLCTSCLGHSAAPSLIHTCVRGRFMWPLDGPAKVTNVTELVLDSEWGLEGVDGGWILDVG